MTDGAADETVRGAAFHGEGGCGEATSLWIMAEAAEIGPLPQYAAAPI